MSPGTKPFQDDNFEKMMEQGAGSDDAQKKMMAQMAQNQGTMPTGSKSKSDPSVSALIGLVTPDTWISDLYGAPRQKDLGENQKNNNHTPLDKNKLDSKHSQEITPAHRKFFKKYQQEYEQFLDQKKKKAEQQKKQEEDDQKKRKEEEQKRRQQEENQIGGGEGKQKQKLGQPRRKATTEQHPETKAGGAK